MIDNTFSPPADPKPADHVARQVITFSLEYPPKLVQETDEDGEPLFNEDGTPVIATRTLSDGSTPLKISLGSAFIETFEVDEDGRTVRKDEKNEGSFTDDEFDLLVQALASWVSRYSAGTGLTVDLTPTSPPNQEPEQTP